MDRERGEHGTGCRLERTTARHPVHRGGTRRRAGDEARGGRAHGSARHCGAPRRVVRYVPYPPTRGSRRPVRACLQRRCRYGGERHDRPRDPGRPARGRCDRRAIRWRRACVRDRLSDARPASQNEGVRRRGRDGRAPDCLACERRADGDTAHTYIRRRDRRPACLPRDVRPLPRAARRLARVVTG